MSQPPPIYHVSFSLCHFGLHIVATRCRRVLLLSVQIGAAPCAGQGPEFVEDYLLARLGPDKQHAEVHSVPSVPAWHPAVSWPNLSNPATCCARCGCWTKGSVQRLLWSRHPVGRPSRGSHAPRGRRWGWTAWSSRRISSWAGQTGMPTIRWAGFESCDDSLRNMQ